MIESSPKPINAEESATPPAVGGAAGWIYREDNSEQVLDRMAQPSICQLIPGAPAVRDGDDQTAATQAGQVVGHALP